LRGRVWLLWAPRPRRRPDGVRSGCRAGSCRERERRCGPNPVKSAGQVRLPLGDSRQGACSCPGRRHRRCHWRLHPARFPSGGARSTEVSDRGTGRSVAPAGSSRVVCGGEQVLVVAPDGVAVEDVQVSVAGGCLVVVGLECRLAAQSRCHADRELHLGRHGRRSSGRACGSGGSWCRAAGFQRAGPSLRRKRGPLSDASRDGEGRSWTV
jgi:hypothetical protein